MHNGIVKRLNDLKRFGFIKRKTGPDIFFNQSGIGLDGFKSLKEGDRVTFEIEYGQLGPAAVNVTVV